MTTEGINLRGLSGIRRQPFNRIGLKAEVDEQSYNPDCHKTSLEDRSDSVESRGLDSRSSGQQCFTRQMFVDYNLRRALTPT